MKIFPESSYGFLPLIDCGEIITGTTPSKKNLDFWGGDIPFVTPAQLGEQSKILESNDFVTKEGANAGRILPRNTTLVCCIGSLGKTGIIHEDSICNQQINAVNFDKQIVNYKFGYYALNNLSNVLNHIASSTTLKIVNKSKFGKIQIPLPPLDEQKRIAEILDAADALRAKRREALAKLDDLLQSTFLDMFGDPVTNPKGWEELTVGDVTDCIVPGRDKPKSFTGSTPWITTDDLINLAVTSHSPKGIGLNDKEIAEVRARVIPKGSVIITCVGDLGVSSIAGCELVVNQQLHTFQCREKINAEYLTFCLPFRKPWMKRRATQTTLPYLNKSNCNSIPIVLPPLDLQQRFAEIVTSVEDQKAKMRKHLEQLDDLFASLQQCAFRGDL